MNKMDFYKFLKQQYKDYKIEYETLSASCEGCPCKTLRKKYLAHMSNQYVQMRWHT